MVPALLEPVAEAAQVGRVGAARRLGERRRGEEAVDRGFGLHPDALSLESGHVLRSSHRRRGPLDRHARAAGRDLRERRHRSRATRARGAHRSNGSSSAWRRTARRCPFWRCATASSPGGACRSASRMPAPAIEVARAAGAEEIALVGFSMGGAVSVHVADDPAVSTVIALAPWLYPELDVSPLDGRRFAVLHGSLDRGLPGVPGVRPELSLKGYERAKARGVDASRQVIRGAIHPIALRDAVGENGAHAARRRVGRTSSAASWRDCARRALPGRPRSGVRARPPAVSNRDRRPRAAGAVRGGGEPRVAARPAAARARHSPAAALPRQGRALALSAGRVADGRARRDPDPARPARPALGRRAPRSSCARASASRSSRRER